MSASLSRLQSFYSGLKAPLLLHAIITREFPGHVAVLACAPDEAGVLLAMVSTVDPAIPVLLLEKNSLSFEKPTPLEKLAARLSLQNVRALHMSPEQLAHEVDALGFLALITDERSGAGPRIELDENGIFRIHPLKGLDGDKFKAAALSWSV
jgi:hypothetical protein